ncbi:MAG: SPOR domain-containing protein [Bacteroidales bacterium]|nr:SPOR domain-containing protein [Bacteroidales bacterium]MCF6341325.1 SPOR domain-containing protein [Bacteroidales bacterium]
MKNPVIYILFLLLLTGAAGAQNSNHEDSRIDSLLQLHIAYNAAFPAMPGYRIQLFMESGNDALENAEEILEKFQEKHDDVPAYITFGEPYYRVRVGDFRTRLEAIRFLDKIQRSYPQAWTVKDKISFPVLSTYQKTINYE